jgi:hypothetical protein
MLIHNTSNETEKMNYGAIYERLIQRARTRVLEGYKERHHVVPRCLGGSNEPENLVYLTAPEHAVAHLLLVKMHPGNLKLVFAANIMLVNANGVRYPMPTNKQYGWLKERAAKAMGRIRRGSKHTYDARKKIGDALRGVPKSTGHRASLSAAGVGKPSPRRGVTLPDETKAKMSKSAFVRPDKAENSERISKAQATRSPDDRKSAASKAWETRRKNGTDKFSAEQRAKMSASQNARDESPEAARARALKAHETRRANGTDTYTAEQRERMSAAHKGKKQSPETVAKRQATIARNRALKSGNTSDT